MCETVHEPCVAVTFPYVFNAFVQDFDETLVYEVGFHMSTFFHRVFFGQEMALKRTAGAILKALALHLQALMTEVRHLCCCNTP